MFLVSILDLDYLFGEKYFYRRAVTFNNPNQLGYWALMAITVLFILKKICLDQSKDSFEILSLKESKDLSKENRKQLF